MCADAGRLAVLCCSYWCASCRRGDAGVRPLLLQRGHSLSIVLFEMKDLQRMHKRLTEEKACRDVLSQLIKKNAVEFFEAFERALEEAKRLELEPSREPLVAEAKRQFDSVRDRIEVSPRVNAPCV